MATMPASSSTTSSDSAAKARKNSVKGCNGDMKRTETGKVVLKVLLSAVIVLGGLFLLLQKVALPASLMPPETIFDLRYYSETLQRLENGLSTFSDSDLRGELAALLARQKTIALAIFVGGCIVLGTGLLLGMGYKRRKPFRKEEIG